MFRRMAQGLVVCLLAVVMLGAGDASGRFNRIGHQMMCACGCGQILLECNHVSCPTSGPMIGELRAQLASGGTDTSVMNWFVGKYGATILAAPIRGGFDTVAWIVPLALFVLATLGTAILIRVWKLRGLKQLPVGGAAGASAGFGQVDAMRERIRRETEY
jgi:cytochrome c-type biogenesis protein CcmH/NrfF